MTQDLVSADSGHFPGEPQQDEQGLWFSRVGLRWAHGRSLRQLKSESVLLPPPPEYGPDRRSLRLAGNHMDKLL
jgi:hypothetical protein